MMVRGGRRSRRGLHDGSRSRSGNTDANRDRPCGNPCGSTRTGSSTSTSGALSLSEHLQRNRKGYNQEECNANRVFSEFPHDNLPPLIKNEPSS
jgi:hypothetical protein